MADRRPISMWNLLALLVVVLGVAATLSLDRLRLERWASSGERRPLGDWYAVDLAAGDQLVYYESSVSVPSGNVNFVIRLEDGDYIHALPPEEDINYRTWLSDRSARALWEISVPEEDTYVFNADNFNIPLTDDDRSGDRIVFGKRPNSLAELTGQRRTIQISGASITLAAAFVLYILHGVELRKRAQTPPDRPYP